MAHMRWDESYSVRSTLLDGHHKLLFYVVDRYHDALHQHATIEVLADLFGQVIDYTAMHFDVEEELMQRSGYPFLKSHKNAHGFLLHRAESLLARINSGDQVACNQAAEFLSDWWEKHIRGIDAQYAPYMEQVVLDDIAV